MHKVTPYTQTTAKLCWEAVGRMMWHWRKGSLRGYTEKAGAVLNDMTGRNPDEMGTFYKQLGMRELKGAKGHNVRHALGWTPVAVHRSGRTRGHAMVVIGYKSSTYYIMDPCGVQSVDFETDQVVCSAGPTKMAKKTFEKELGPEIWYW